MSEPTAPTIWDRLVSWSGGVTKVAGAASVIGIIALEPVQQFLQERLGIKRLDEGLTTLTRRVDRLDPMQDVAIFDSSMSFQVGACYIGERCVVRLRVKRTVRGQPCGAPDIAPWIRNHSGVRRSAEALTPAVRVGDEWDTLESVFIVPSEAQPGRAIYRIDLEYPCPDGMVAQRTPPVPVKLLRRRD